jgi:two-component system, OmpR family, alkaline phosphatase synthesis response regulator PhoP
MSKILIIDDEINIIELAKLYLQREGFAVESAVTGQAGLSLFNTTQPTLVILDIMLPDIDGLEICRRIRAKSQVPILMLSARREEVDKIIGLELGADDYLTKPFNPHELVARVKAILRRTQPGASPPQTIDVGALRLDLPRREAVLAGRKLELRTREFDLLAVLAGNPGIVLSRERLLNQVWGYEYCGETRTVDVHINRLRDKLKASGVDIETLRGAGYKLVAPETRA